jgi:hypothetical protein
MRSRSRWPRCATRWGSWRHWRSKAGRHMTCVVFCSPCFIYLLSSFVLASVTSVSSLYYYFFVYYLSVLVLINILINSFTCFHRSDSLRLEFYHSSLFFLFLSFTCITVRTLLPQSNRVKIMYVCVCVRVFVCLNF